MISHAFRTRSAQDEFRLSLLPAVEPALSEPKQEHHLHQPVWSEEAADSRLERLHVLMPSSSSSSQGYRRSPVVQELSQQATRWLQKLPVPVRPIITARRHPHVVNRLCAIWDDTAARQACFQELLFSSRPGRRGFSFEVMDELVELQSYGARTKRI